MPREYYYIEDPTPPLVLVDGIPVSEHETIYAYDPNLVREITIYTDKYAFGPIYYNGILFLKLTRETFLSWNLMNPCVFRIFKESKTRSLAVLPADSRFLIYVTHYTGSPLWKWTRTSQSH